MTDVVEIAKQRQDALTAEIGRLDYFIRMAEKLVEDNPLVLNEASDTEDETAVETTGPATVRPYSAADDGDGAEAEPEDLSVRKPKARGRARKSRTILAEPAPDQQRGMGLFHRGPT
jgi:hypothetical protein